MEKTLILLKPDCRFANIEGTIIERLQRGGYRILAMKTFLLNDELLAEHYAHIADKPFFPEIADFMKSAPVMAIILAGENVIARTRQKLGVTNSAEAEAGSIRGEYGADKMHNIAHASDSVEAAEDEIKRFFPELVSQCCNPGGCGCK